MNRWGFTLAELIVALAILGVLAGVAAFAVGGDLPTGEASLDPDATLLDSAISLGFPVSRRKVDSTGAAEWTTYMPDGRVIRGGALQGSAVTGNQ
ncbi:MAG TPA: prepilin-type N-terminal cleavage/methylation domain-containing protein [Gemmatimonadaceae bacterium]|jgi:prepilin-type N-terminal cleavage/methylation domain-containing protein